jgi:hypothetical protein
MSSYASYCQDQSTDCARRARLASSPEVATYWRCLGLRWLRLAEQAQRPGDTLVSARDEGKRFPFFDLKLERETAHAKTNADARSL